MTKYPILQSGYTALTSVGLTKPIATTPTFSETILFRESNKEHDPYFYIEDITNLFNDWQADFRIMKDFCFREKILKQAKLAFGPDITDWLNFQALKPSFSYTHKQFLERMCVWMQPYDFQPVLTQDVEILKWIGLLSPGQGHHIHFNYNEVAQELGGIINPANTDEVLSNWMAREGGYESLLTYIFIIFGQRVGHTQYNSQSIVKR